MTNEELAINIKNGESGNISALWEQVRNFVAQQANRLVFGLNGRYGVTVDDLINTGFIAMCAACKTYNHDKGSFLNWLSYYLKTAFAEACGYRTSRRDAMELSDSLDRPLDTSDSDSNTLADLVPDPVDHYGVIDDAIYNSGLHVRLDAVIDTLPPAGAEVIRAIYWNGETTERLSKHMGISENSIRTTKDECIQKLRRAARYTEAGKQLCAYIERNTPYYTHVGTRQFNTTHTSAVEKIVLLRERIEREITRDIQKAPYMRFAGRERGRR